MNIRHFWEGLQPRERISLMLGAGAVLILLLWLLLVEPYRTSVQRLEQSVAARQADLQWMGAAAAELRQLRGSAPSTSMAGQSLLSLADSTARRHGLGEVMNRVQPEGQESVRVWLEGAPFDDVMRWLGALNRQHGVVVSAVVVEPRPQPGLADVRVVLREGA